MRAGRLFGAALAATFLAAAWSRPAAGAAAPDSGLHVGLWEASLHSTPEITHLGQPFDLHLHLIWGSDSGQEVALPDWRARPGLDLLATGYAARRTPEKTGDYGVHAVLTYTLRPTRVGDLRIDSVRATLARGALRRTVVFPATAMRVLPKVSRWPKPWVRWAAGSALALLALGLVLRARQRPRRRAAAEPTPGQRAAARLAAIRAAPPGKRALADLLAYLRAECVRRYGGTWERGGEEAFESWARGSRAPEAVKDRVGVLVQHLETHAYAPGEPEPTVWRHWIEETERLWQVDEALAEAGRS